MSFDTTGLVAYVNGEYKPVSEASVSIFDHGFLYGDGVFEGMRVFDGGLFRAELHMERIARSLSCQIHPLALMQHENLNDQALSAQISNHIRGFKNGEDFFIEKLSFGIARIAAAFFAEGWIGQYIIVPGFRGSDQ